MPPFKNFVEPKRLHSRFHDQQAVQSEVRRTAVLYRARDFDCKPLLKSQTTEFHNVCMLYCKFYDILTTVP